jgi:phospholipase/carboxylesterase
MLSITPFKFEFIEAREARPSKKLLILVHGRTGNLKLLQWYSKRFDIADLSYLAIQAPYPDQRPDQKEPGFSWYLKDRTGIDEVRVGLAKMIEEIKSQGFYAKNIFWMGFSQGAAMSLDVALRSSEIFGGFICVSGLCIQMETYPLAFGPTAKQQRILITHGRRDEIVPLETAEENYRVLREEHIPFEWKIFDKPHSFHLREEVPMIEARLKSWIAE